MITDFDYKNIADNIFEEIQKLNEKNVPNLRKIRKKYSKILHETAPEHVLDLARYFLRNYDYRWIAFELINQHQAAIKAIGLNELKEFGQEINS